MPPESAPNADPSDPPALAAPSRRPRYWLRDWLKAKLREAPESAARSYNEKRSSDIIKGRRVLVAFCPCGWRHMTAYRLLHKGAAREYLIRRYNAHPCEVVRAT